MLLKIRNAPSAELTPFTNPAAVFTCCADDVPCIAIVIAATNAAPRSASRTVASGKIVVEPKRSSFRPDAHC
jgi:hypothetical protein